MRRREIVRRESELRSGSGSEQGEREGRNKEGVRREETAISRLGGDAVSLIRGFSPKNNSRF